MTVENIPGVFLVDLEFLRLGQLLKAGADGSDLETQSETDKASPPPT